jgi:hypothetical protein
MATNLRLQSAALVVLLLVSSIGAPASAQATFVDPKQPTPDNNIMAIYGNSDLSNCFSHFDTNDTTGSAAEGYGEQVWTQANTQIEMDYTCRAESFKQDMYLEENGTIRIRLDFKIYADTNNCDQDNVDCTNLTLTLYKGGIELAMQEFPAIATNDNDDSVIWDIDIDRNMTRFNRSGEEPQLRVQFSAPGYNGFFGCQFAYCGGEFRMYYSTPGNDSGIADFPVVNQSMPGGGDDDSGIGGAVGDALPGFGLMAGMAALAMAAIAGSRINRREE